MNLPANTDRCFGMTAWSICEKREGCRRFLPPGSKMRGVWFVPAQIPGPCIYFQPIEKGRAE